MNSSLYLVPSSGSPSKTPVTIPLSSGNINSEIIIGTNTCPEPSVNHTYSIDCYTFGSTLIASSSSKNISNGFTTAAVIEYTPSFSTYVASVDSVLTFAVTGAHFYSTTDVKAKITIHDDLGLTVNEDAAHTTSYNAPFKTIEFYAPVSSGSINLLLKVTNPDSAKTGSV